MVYHPQVGSDLDTGIDTIAAIATPAGVGGIGIIRLSGPLAAQLAEQMTDKPLQEGKAQYRKFLDCQGRMLDDGIVLYFPAPRSYTGENVCELQCHGGPVVLNLLLVRLMELGARPAEPGEFTRRAFLNDKLDLAQAEAVADLINSSTAAAARSAMRSLHGEFSKRVNKIHQSLLNLRIYVEAAMDFPEEEIDFLADSELMGSVESLCGRLDDLTELTAQGCILREGLDVVIAGLPNAGKSSLLNRFAGEDRAIVTAQPGTTRDVIEVMINVNGVAVRLTDTAGLRKNDDPVESEGIRRAWRATESADLVLYVIDSVLGVCPEDQRNLNDLKKSKVAVVWNKTDLTGAVESPFSESSTEEVFVSALTGKGTDSICKLIQKLAGINTQEEGLFAARRRHLESLFRASDYVDRARQALLHRQAGELAAQDLRDAMDELGQIVGTVSADELLGEIFSSFCIGK